MVAGKAQDDLPVINEHELQLVPGLYLSFNDFIYNDPVDFEQVQGDLATFFDNPMNAKELIITRGDSVYRVEQSQVGGYTEGKNVFLNRSLFKGMNIDAVGLRMIVEPWVKIHTIGTLCFIYYLTTVNIDDKGYFPRTLKSSSETRIMSETQFIFYTRNGQFYEGNLKELKDLISDDYKLLGELEKARGDKEVRFFTFLKKYNMQHPFKFR
jgi:hypothetical protein